MIFVFLFCGYLLHFGCFGRFLYWACYLISLGFAVWVGFCVLVLVFLFVCLLAPCGFAGVVVLARESFAAFILCGVFAFVLWF